MKPRRAHCVFPLLLSLVAACGPLPAQNTGDSAAPTDGATMPIDSALPGDGALPGDSAAPTPEAGSDASETVPADPAQRTSAQVCGHWSSERALSAMAPAWMRGATMCDVGTLPLAAQQAAVRHTNLYRWLVGLPPVPHDPASSTLAQACAVLEEANNMLSHMPPMTWTCYTAAGAMGASTSNITSGGSSPVASIDSWINDSNDISMTLGHRRWMLYPPLGPIGYGQATRYACLRVLGTGRGAGTAPWIAWPNPGPTPSEVTPSIWSFSAATVIAGTAVTVTRDGAALTVMAQMRTSGYGDPTISWSMPAVVPGAVYAVTVSGLMGGAPVSYEVRPARCG